MKSVINSTIAAKMNLHHESQLSKADSVANGIDRKLTGLWNQILAVLSSKRGVMEKQFAIRNLLMQIVDQSASKLHTGLKTIATQSYKDAANVLSKNVPIGHLNLVASKKPVLEDKDAIRQQINDAVFDQLPPEKIDKIVRGTTAGMSWQGRLAQQTAKGSPDQLASVVTMGYLSGATPDSLAGKLKPFVQGISSTARRIARNESMRIAHESSMEAYEELGDMVVGYQIHATMDSRVRPHHAARSGNIYYKKPKPGQLSATKMPRPPLEEDGTVAHNCRCWITPVLEVQTHIEEDPATKAIFTDNKDKLIPNPAVYTDWFATASEEDRRRVVGARRLNVIRKRLKPGENIQWGHFVNPKTGKLLDHDELKIETPKKQKNRLQKFNDLIQKRKQLTHDVYTYGYESTDLKSLSVTSIPAPILSPVVLPQEPLASVPTVLPAKISTFSAKEFPKHLNLKPPQTDIIEMLLLKEHSNLDNVAKELGVAVAKTPKGRKKMLEKVDAKVSVLLAKVVAKGKPKIRTSLDGILGIIKDNQFKTQFETKTSGGALDNSLRRSVEHDNIGVPKNHEDAKRPVYGYIHEDGQPDHTTWYGDFEFTLKREVLNTATITYGDSLNRAFSIVASSALNPSARSVPLDNTLNIQRLKNLESSTEYLEAQYHEKLTLDNVEFLVIHKNPPTAASDDKNKSPQDKILHDIIKAMKDRGINVIFKPK